jgi:methylase of polypeptide subunit release factors
MNQTMNISGIEVILKDTPDILIDGGGHEIHDELIECVQTWYPDRIFKNCFEWCSGPGTLGLSILGSKLADHICLADVYPISLNAIHKTVELNNIKPYVTVYLSDNLKSIPETEKFDLVIGNPPHFSTPIQQLEHIDQYHRLYVDDNWKLHQGFFENINNYLLPNAKIILFESVWGSSVHTFRKMITDNGFKINRYGFSKTRPTIDYWWFMEIIKD